MTAIAKKLLHSLARLEVSRSDGGEYFFLLYLLSLWQGPSGLLWGAKAPAVASNALSRCPLDHKQEEHPGGLLAVEKADITI